MTYKKLRRISQVLVFILIVVPPFCDVASAQVAPPSDTPEIIDFEGIGITDIEISESPEDGRPVVAANISFGDDSTHIEMHDATLTFGNGYAMHVQNLVRSSVEESVDVVTESPDGRTTTVTMRHDLMTGRTTSGDMTAMRSLLEESGDLQLITAGLPALASLAGDTLNTMASLRTRSTGWLGCAGALLQLAGAMAAVVVACSIPEPFYPVACGGAVLVLIGAFLQTVDACNFPDRCTQPC